MHLRGRFVMCALMLLAPWTHAHAEGQPDAQYCSLLPALEADGERANASVVWQVGLGHAFLAATLRVFLDGFEETTARGPSRGTPTPAGGTLTSLPSIPQSGPCHHRRLGAWRALRFEKFADFEENATNMTFPSGANDGGSGVGAVGELMRIIPSMSLEHAVVVVLFDAEDQGTYTDKESWAEGSRRWADN